MTHCLFLALVTCAADPANSSSADVPRPLYEILRDVRALCQQDSRARTGPERAAAAVAMTELYQEIRTDPRYPTSPTLKEYRARLWSRLTHIKKDVESKMRRAGSGDDRADGVRETESALATITAVSLGDHLSLIGAGLGGPAGVFSQAGTGSPGGGAVADYGPDLVALIQRTIQPEFWDVNGGPGTVVYYRPLHCLVVRATSEVHHRLGGTLGDLRTAP